jgi:DNA-binding transcriptional regulator YdaS (Cro superfamily)
MTPKQAIARYGTQARLARVLGVSLQVVNNWKRRDWIPLERQLEIVLSQDLTSQVKLKLSRKRRRSKT